MAVHAAQMRSALSGFLVRHPEDGVRLIAVGTALAEAGDTVASRAEFRGHATAGAVLVDHDDRVLQIRHRALGTWLLPGGHLEEGDEDLQGAALRELCEETGMDAAAIGPAGTALLDIDVHVIPPNPAKGEPAHPHFDFRYLFRLRTADAVTRLQTDEVSAVRWVPAAGLACPRLGSRLRRALARPAMRTPQARP